MPQFPKQHTFLALWARPPACPAPTRAALPVPLEATLPRVQLRAGAELAPDALGPGPVLFVGSD